MSKTRLSTLRRLLPLSILAVLLLAAAPPLPADEIAVGVSTGYHKAGLRVGVGVGLGYWGHHHYYPGYWRPYYPRIYPYVYPYATYDYWGPYTRYRRYGHFGALDLNVRPKKTTQVYVDGNFVGTAGNFDGWPQYLWLEKDTYEVIFYNPGYETVVRHVEVQPGVVIKIREEMRPGESVPVAELTTAGRPPRAPAYGPAPREPPVERRVEPRPAPPEPAAPGLLDVRPEPARVRIQVAPADASVYLDGRFLGVAGELGEERSGILIEPGEHLLEVVRPGYRSREVSFEAVSGGEVLLELELESGAASAGYSA